MKGELRYILNKYSIDLEQHKLYQPIEIPSMTRVGNLAPLFRELNYKVGVEVGVERALFTEVLCEANPQAMIYGVDPWTAYRGYRDHVSQDKLDGFYQDARQRVDKYGNCRLLRMFSPEAANTFADNELDFVYIDANHRLECVINDIVAWGKKVRSGGIISGHDYRQFKRQTYSHIPEAVIAYTRAYLIHPWFLLGKRSEPKPIRDGPRSWMWVKG